MWSLRITIYVSTFGMLNRLNHVAICKVSTIRLYFRFHKCFVSGGEQWSFPSLELTRSPVSQTMVPGQSSLLDCGWTGDQGDTVVTWTRDGVPVTSGSQGWSQLANGSLQVTMDRAGQRVGVYQCRVSRQEVGTVLSTPASINRAGTSSSPQTFIYFIRL